ncbi:MULTISPECIES: GntR family transcriptional regulator [Streptomyces]|uniref:GntR family transcriptional regulator n=2 Tax=Streptomyces rimosus subsp. rimosus TaxID=132474 RepID=L8F1Z3_STRR1|nr:MULTISPECIES: GntR family transcriptional regulator [Streptomyces]KOG70544.1 hypothetical protein ADK78_28565 [Kitasatospora aureofaciens]MYT47324.1 GntR family transcriptional regulator [Streptomyces sp. SID5471]KEF04654.1 hypothetical protein DF17_22465 [Streptomyces rimosus]KOT31370.1 hypothetical protein ADK84_30080 [Streptomyces sp. NRRL WC-3701]KOT32229.1 hypothetical protein ADK42_26520 [Streptomyces rimosus subsp. rimosus]
MAEAAYLRVAAELRAAIDAGEYAPGTTLPSGADIAENYGLARATAQKALQQLATDGYVDLFRRRRAVVRSRPRERAVIRDRIVYRDEIGYFFDRNAVNWRPVSAPTRRIGPPPNHVADLLGTPRGENVLIRDRAMGPPGAKHALQLAISYLPLSLVAEIPVVGGDKTGPGGIYDRIEEHYEAPIAWRETVSARTAGSAEQERLGIPAAVPVLVVTREATVPRDGEVLPVEVNETTMSAEQFAVAYAISRDASAAWSGGTA